MRIIKPARRTGADVPVIQGMEYADGAVIPAGAPLVMNAGNVVEAASPVALANLVGFTMEPTDSHPGFQAANNPSQVTGRANIVAVAKANKIQQFSAAFVNGDANPIAPTKADIKQRYGLSKQNGTWVVDKSLTAGNATVTIEDIDTDLNIVFFTCN